MSDTCDKRGPHEVVRTEARPDYSYLIVFDDGTRAVVDLSEYVDKGPVFAPLKDPEFFKQARVEGGTITWPNGADIALETLYERCPQAAALAGGRATGVDDAR
jgi:hypothetical protein